ncbi:MAG: nucleoside monophosphate kinase, partial [Atopostipes suicloacalis]|nr:nucleoside monophosphate kinase [Atopostipes suicloacalis]
RLILDGYPRTLNQAHALDQLLQTDPLVFYFDLPRNILMDRLLDRGRADDTRDIINHRFEVYQEETEPLIHYYRQKDLLVQIQAESSAAIFNKIESYL